MPRPFQCEPVEGSLPTKRIWIPLLEVFLVPRHQYYDFQGRYSTSHLALLKGFLPSSQPPLGLNPFFLSSTTSSGQLPDSIGDDFARTGLGVGRLLIPLMVVTVFPRG